MAEMDSILHLFDGEDEGNSCIYDGEDEVEQTREMKKQIEKSISGEL